MEEEEKSFFNDKSVYMIVEIFYLKFFICFLVRLYILDKNVMKVLFQFDI